MEQDWASTLSQENAAVMWRESEHPHPQRAFIARPLEPQPQLLSGLRHPHSLVHSQSWQPDLGWDWVAVRISAPWTLTINANARAIGTARRKTTFIVKSV